MAHKILRYNPDLSFANAPSLRVSVQMEEPGQPVKTVDMVATDSDARAICVMERNPDWNGKPGEEDGVSEMSATGEIDFRALRTFVDAQIVKARSPELPTFLADRLEKITALEDRAQTTASSLREAEKKLDEVVGKEHTLSLALTAKTEELANAIALIEVRKAEATLLGHSLEQIILEVEKAKQELDAFEAKALGTVVPVPAGPPTQYAPGDRVYLVGDPKRYIGVVSFVERTVSGKLYHVSWTGGPAPKGTHRYKELYPEGYTPPAVETLTREGGG